MKKVKKYCKRSHEVIFPVFNNYKITVVISNDPERARKECPLYSELDEPFHACHSYDPDSPNAHLFLQSEKEIDTITHECWHAIHRMMNWFNVGVENEVYAYHLGYLTNEVYKLYK